MAVTYYNAAKTKILKGEIDLESADIRCVPIMDPATTTYDPQAAGEEDRATLGAFFGGTGIAGTAELDDTGYTRPAATLGTQVVTEDTANDRSYMTAADTVLSGLNQDNTGGGIAGILYYLFVTDFASSIPIVYAPYSAIQTPGASFTIQHNASGIVGVA